MANITLSADAAMGVAVSILMSSFAISSMREPAAAPVRSKGRVLPGPVKSRLPRPSRSAAMEFFLFVAGWRSANLGRADEKTPAREYARPAGCEGVETIEAFLDSTALTPRERETAVLLLRDAPTTDIAHAMGISESTAKKHILRVLRKFGVPSRHALVLRSVMSVRSPTTVLTMSREMAVRRKMIRREAYRKTRRIPKNDHHNSLFIW
jgi:Response regulator containing a CheY-like receiver domain and an HTH DNA-binding domain